MGSKEVLERGSLTLGEVEGGSCPFLEKVNGEGGYPVEGFCLAYRDGRLRIPSLGEVRSFCRGGCYIDCPTYLYRLQEEQEQAGGLLTVREGGGR